MPRFLATTIILLYIAYVLYADRERQRQVSRAIWVPFSWMFLASSRYVSGWLDLGARGVDAASYVDGNPLDRGVFLALVVAGALVVLTRRIDWSSFIRRNFLVVVYFTYALVSVVWSPYPSVSFKRWIKVVGNVIMVLIVLTEDDPLGAFLFIMYRLMIILMPLSVLFIKYYPEWGRSFHLSEPYFNGAMLQKNGLGRECMQGLLIVGWSFFVNTDEKYRICGRRHRSHQLLIYSTLLPMLIWNLIKSDSKMSLVSVVVGIVLILWMRHPQVQKGPARVLGRVFLAASAIAALELIFGVSALIFEVLGRDASLTTRVPMWNTLLSLPNNMWVGSGHESYWMGDRLENLWESFGRLNNAHNGYLETYLNLGLVGLSLLIGYVLLGFGNLRRRLVAHYSFGVLSAAFTIVVLLYNWTEATFYTVSSPWIILLYCILDVRRIKAIAPETVEPHLLVRQPKGTTA
jgi:exopolysaccharide production protein ExoQ